MTPKKGKKKEVPVISNCPFGCQERLLQRGEKKWCLVFVFFVFLFRSLHSCKNDEKEAWCGPQDSYHQEARVFDARLSSARVVMEKASHKSFSNMLALSPNQRPPRYHNEDDARRVYESGETFTLDGRRLDLQYAQGKRKSKSGLPLTTGPQETVSDRRL